MQKLARLKEYYVKEVPGSAPKAGSYGGSLKNKVYGVARKAGGGVPREETAPCMCVHMCACVLASEAGGDMWVRRFWEGLLESWEAQ